MIRGTFGLVHTIAAVLALLAGLLIFVRPKATLFHRSLGYTYSASMTVVLVTAFFTYNLTQSFNLLHAFAILSCPPLLLGFFAAFRRRPGWLPNHYEWMCYSYLGLVAAFISETATRVLMPYVIAEYQVRTLLPFWGMVGISTALVFYLGVRLIERNKRLIAKFNHVSGAA